MSTSNGDTLPVPLEILSDEVVEGLHNFTAEVQQSSLVYPWSSAHIYIVDNDSECSNISKYFPCGSHAILVNSRCDSTDG